MKSAANHPITITKRNAMKRTYKTMNCGIAKMTRKATVHRFCAVVPANHISTRLVGTTIGAFVMSPPGTPSVAGGDCHPKR